MDVFPKFIIKTDDELGDCLIIAKCSYRKDLADDASKVKGGGWWVFKDNTFVMYGDSHDFGAATIEDIKNCVNSGNVFTNSMLINSIAEDHEFGYNTGTEIISLKNDVGEKNGLSKLRAHGV